MTKTIEDFPINQMNIDNLDYAQLMVLTRLLLNAEENYGRDGRLDQMNDCFYMLEQVRDRRAELRAELLAEQ